ncbi:MAG: histidine phosphatase family protein [Pyrinomonadaceae bacterium]
MKIFFSIFLGFALFTLANTVLVAQDREVTIILVRHAEKADLTSPDPELSDAGKERAQRLVKKIGKYRPGAFYSTDYKRTRDTVTPLANKRKKDVKIYDARKPKELIDEIMKGKIKRYVIAGHSNTVPGLANLIAKKEMFKNLEDSEYTIIWLIRMKNGKVTKFELLDY